MSRRTCLLLVGWLLGIVWSAPTRLVAEQTENTSESWSVVYMAGQRVGYGRHRTLREVRRGSVVIITASEEHISVRRFGQQLKISSKSRYEETEAGDLISFAWEMQNAPAQPAKSVGRVEGNRLSVESTVNGRSRTQTIDLEPGAKSPAYQDRLVKESPLKPGEIRSFKAFVPEFGKVGDFKVVADIKRPTKLHDGRERELLKLKVTQSLLPGITTSVFVDDDGESLKVEAGLLGMVTYSVSKDVALEAIVGAELDVAVGTLIPLNYPSVKLHQAKKVIYRVKLAEPELAPLIPASETQSVKMSAAASFELTVIAGQILKNVAANPRDKPEFQGETAYLQSKDARVQEHANRAAAGSIDPGTMAIRMEKYVHTELKKKNFSTALASAAEVAKSMEGDCTEHACLLAAMLRAKQIPARVAVGYVYVEKLAAFGGHMWTEAWIGGKWVALDGTLGLGGIGGGHIKLGDSDLADAGPAPVSAFLPLLNLTGNVQIDVLKVE